MKTYSFLSKTESVNFALCIQYLFWHAMDMQSIYVFIVLSLSHTLGVGQCVLSSCFVISGKYMYMYCDYDIYDSFNCYQGK